MKTIQEGSTMSSIFQAIKNAIQPQYTYSRPFIVNGRVCWTLLRNGIPVAILKEKR